MKKFTFPCRLEYFKNNLIGCFTFSNDCQNRKTPLSLKKKNKKTKQNKNNDNLSHIHCPAICRVIVTENTADWPQRTSYCVLEHARTNSRTQLQSLDFIFFSWWVQHKSENDKPVRFKILTELKESIWHPSHYIDCSYCAKLKVAFGELPKLSIFCQEEN